MRGWPKLGYRLSVAGGGCLIVVLWCGVCAGQAPANRTEILVPVVPNRLSAATVQAAIDMAKGPTDVACSLKTSDGFAVDGKDIGVYFQGTKVTGGITFSNCPSGATNGFVGSPSVGVDRSKNIVIGGSEIGDLTIRVSEAVTVGKARIHAAFVEKCAGVSITYCAFEGGEGAVTIRDCTVAGPPSMSQFAMTRSVLVSQCSFTKIGGSPALWAERSRICATYNTFDHVGFRGIELHHCTDATLRRNNFSHIGDAAICFFDSEGEAQENTVGGGMTVTTMKGSGSGTAGIYVDTENTEQPPLRSNVRLWNNQIQGAQEGITVYRADAKIDQNRVSDADWGIIAATDAGVTMTGNVLRVVKYFGVVGIEARPGLLIETTDVDRVGVYGMLLAMLDKCTVRATQWRVDSEHRNPVSMGGFEVIKANVHMENVSVSGPYSSWGLLAESGSNIDGQNVSLNCSGTGGGLLADGSVVKGSIGSWTAGGTPLQVTGAAQVDLNNAELLTQTGQSLLMDGGSTLSLTQARVRGITQRTGNAATLDLAVIDGESKAQFANAEFQNGYGGALVKVSGGSNVTMMSCDMGATRVGEGGVSTGPPDGLVVEGEKSMVAWQQGQITHNGACVLRAASGGGLKASGLTITGCTTAARADAGGTLTLEGCTMGPLNSPGGKGVVEIQGGGSGIVRACTIQNFATCGVYVAGGGKAELTGNRIRGGQVGFNLQPGSSVTQSANQFDVKRNIAGEGN